MVRQPFISWSLFKVSPASHLKLVADEVSLRAEDQTDAAHIAEFLSKLPPEGRFGRLIEPGVAASLIDNHQAARVAGWFTEFSPQQKAALMYQVGVSTALAHNDQIATIAAWTDSLSDEEMIAFWTDGTHANGVATSGNLAIVQRDMARLPIDKQIDVLSHASIWNAHDRGGELDQLIAKVNAMPAPHRARIYGNKGVSGYLDAKDLDVSNNHATPLPASECVRRGIQSPRTLCAPRT